MVQREYYVWIICQDAFIGSSKLIQNSSFAFVGELLYDLEWNNGTVFRYTLDDGKKKCSSALVDVGILRPNWLDGATYLGQQFIDGFHCNVWQKVDFIWYYEDIVTKRPVHWVFYTGTLHPLHPSLFNLPFYDVWT